MQNSGLRGRVAGRTRRKPTRKCTVEDWLSWAKGRIDALDAELIALWAFSDDADDRSWLIAHMDEEEDRYAISTANDLVMKRASGVPLAYLLGEKEFYGRTFVVTPDVLVPRPETEGLIDLIKELDLPKAAQFLDVGTGSGCIAVTLALEYPQSEVLAVDVSSDALDVAEMNDRQHEARLVIRKSDLLLGVSDMEFETNKTLKVDVLVANLPYVNPSWDWLDLKALEHEPIEALFSLRENGLSLYRRLFVELGQKLVIAKYVVLEADPCQQDELVELARKFHWKLHKKRGYGLVFVRAER